MLSRDSIIAIGFSMNLLGLRGLMLIVNANVMYFISVDKDLLIAFIIIFSSSILIFLFILYYYNYLIFCFELLSRFD